MSNIDTIIPVWMEAEAFKIGDEIYPIWYISIEDAEDLDACILTAMRVSETFEIYEEYITVEMINDGEIIDDIYTLRVVDERGHLLNIIPLFFAGQKKYVYSRGRSKGDGKKK